MIRCATSKIEWQTGFRYIELRSRAFCAGQRNFARFEPDGHMRNRIRLLATISGGKCKVGIRAVCPGNGKELQRFLGLVNYNREYIQSMADLIKCWALIAARRKWCS